jgi:hypothetical protein
MAIPGEHETKRADPGPSDEGIGDTFVSTLFLSLRAKRSKGGAEF